MQRPLPARPPGDISPGTAVVIILYFLVVAGIGFWARGVATAVPGPGTIKQSEQGDVYVQVGTELLRVTPDGVDVRAYDLARLGVDRLFDFVLLDDEKILVRLGPYRKTFLENIAMYMRLPNTKPVSAAPAGTGLYTCDLAAMSCAPFSRNFDMDDVHWLAYDRETQELYVADSSRHQLHKLGADGVLRATQAEGFIFPNHISVVNGQLRVVDTNNRAIKLVNGREEPFGALVREENPVNSSVRNAGHGYPSMLADLGDEHWVLIMNNSMARGGVYRYSKDWRHLGRVALPDVENADYIARVGDGVWVSDGSGWRVVQLNAKGVQAGELRSQAFLQRMAENNRSHERWMGFSYVAAGLFIFSVVAGVIVGLRKETKRTGALDGVRYERVPVNLESPDIQWIEQNPSVRRYLYLFGGLMVLLIMMMGALFLAGPAAVGTKSSGTPTIFLAMPAMILFMVAMMFQLLRHRIGVMGDVLIVQRGKEHRAARGKSIVYSGGHVAIDDIIVPLGSGAMPLYRTEDIVTRLHPLIQHATVIGMREMQTYQLRHMKKVHWALVVVSLLLVLFLLAYR